MASGVRALRAAATFHLLAGREALPAKRLPELIEDEFHVVELSVVDGGHDRVVMDDRDLPEIGRQEVIDAPAVARLERFVRGTEPVRELLTTLRIERLGIGAHEMQQRAVVDPENPLPAQQTLVLQLEIAAECELGIEAADFLPECIGEAGGDREAA